MKSHQFSTYVSWWVVITLLGSCALMPQPVSQQNASRSQVLNGINVQQASVRTDSAAPQMISIPNMVPPQPVEQTVSLPSVPASQSQTLDFVTGTPASSQIKMPANGSFKLITVAGPSFQILDNDATDGIAKVQVTGPAFDLYIRPEASSTTPVTCPSPTPTSATGLQLLDQIDQAVLTKANQLNAAGQSQCVYLPPANQRQNANCNTTSTGFQCSGPLNKTISVASCPEIAIYGGAMNINNALPDSKIFAAMQNNLTINQSVNGILSSRGDLNTNLSNNSQLNGVFIGARSSNLNLSGGAKIQGLYSILNNGSLSMNMNPSAIFEGELCTTGTANLNRNGNSQMIYNPNKITAWQSDLGFINGMMCSPGNKPYTQQVSLICPTPAPVTNGSVKIEDTLYYVEETLNPDSDRHWYRMPGRPMPVPDTWFSPDDSQYILKFINSGLPQISLRLINSQQNKFPVGVSEIGPEGGIISLPGVADVVFAKSVLSTRQVFSVRQVLNFPAIQSKGIEFVGKELAGPVISIKPEIDLVSNYISAIRIKLYKDKLSLIDPFFLTYAEWFSSKPEERDILAILAGENSYPTLDTLFRLKRTGIVAPLYDSNQMNFFEKHNINISDEHANFGIQQANNSAPTTYWASEGNLYVEPAGFSPSVRDRIDQIAELSWDYYKKFQNTPSQDNPVKIKEVQTYYGNCVPAPLNLVSQCMVSGTYFFVPIIAGDTVTAPGPGLAGVVTNGYELHFDPFLSSHQLETTLFHELWHLFQFVYLNYSSSRDCTFQLKAIK